MYYIGRVLLFSPLWVCLAVGAGISYAEAQTLQPVSSTSAQTAMLSSSAAGQTGIQNNETENLPNTPVIADLRQRLSDPQSAESVQAYDVKLHSPTLVQQFYSQRQYQSAWLGADGKPTLLAEDLLVAVLNAKRDGLRAEYYHGKALTNHLRSLRIAFTPTTRQLADIDLLLSDAFLSFGSDLLSGRTNPKQIDKDWVLTPRSQDLTQVLQQALAQQKVQQALADLSPKHSAYARTRASLAHYRTLETMGGWPVLSNGKKLEAQMRSPRVQELRTRLNISGDLASTVPVTDPFLYDDAVIKAVSHFQERHGLKPDGVLGPRTLAAMNIPISERIRQLEINLERWRWLPEDLGQRHVLVNIPNFKMSVIENDREVIGSKVVVGMSKRPTPVFTADMKYLVLSPYWHVPRTIAVEDKLPVLRKNPYSLRKQGIRVFSNGREIDPGSVNWNSISKSNFPYSMRQDPGPSNALGGIKFMFPNRHSVYLHDTSSPHLFNRVQRTYSSGCVRVEGAYQLAEYLLKGDGNWTRDSIKKASKTRRERRVDLSSSIPVHLLYWTAWTGEDGAVHFRNDIYERDITLENALLTI